MNNKNRLCVLLALVFAFLLAYEYFFPGRYGIFSRDELPAMNSNPVSGAQTNVPQRQYADPGKNALSDITDFPVNAPLDFNYKTKEEIYAIRTQFVQKSLFWDEAYSPSQTVFGRIAGNKPWIGIKSAHYRWDGAQPNEGLSEESRFINNPSALVMLNMPYKNATYGRYFGEDMYMLPKSIVYYKKTNTIKVTYSLEKFLSEIRPKNKTAFIYMLEGTNANDLGYPWGYAYDTEGVAFYEDSIKDKLCRFLNHIHLGMSAGIPGGCNNGSPYQKELNFSILKVPSHVYLKLWKQQPPAISAEADINVDLVFL